MRSATKNLWIGFLVAITVGCDAPATESPPQPAELVSPSKPEDTGLGTGFLVWESNRSGRWRIWIRDLAGGPPRQLSPDEGRHLHCCPHIAPDGEQIVYLSLGPDQGGYPQGGAVGALMGIRPDGSDAQTLLPAARNYYENRAAVWQSPSTLIYIREDGRTAALDLGSRSSTLLTTEADPNGPWLINSALTWAASGNGALAPFLPHRQKVATRPPKPGCQPYFSHDGRWGFWVVAPGGPIDRLDLASENRSTWLQKSDPRLPSDFGYLYFPMLSADSRLLAFAASDEDHPHFEADYEIFVAETDPETLEILGTPQRWTHHPATDRFPDVHLAPLPLGRRFGEAPMRWTADPGNAEVEWRWSYGDGSSSVGPTGEHLYEKPGRYRIVADAGGNQLEGLVSVNPATPPRVQSSFLQSRGTEIVVIFDEPIEISRMTAALDSGTTLTGQTLAGEGRRLTFSVGQPLQEADSLRLEGVEDRHSRPNATGPLDIAIEPPLWPATRSGLVFLWETGDAPNLLFNPDLGAETAVTLTARGSARLDSNFAMRPAGGRFEVAQTDSKRVADACKRTYEMTLEMVLSPASLPTRRGVILTSASKSRRNFTLEQRGQDLFLGLRMKSRGEAAMGRALLARLPQNRQTHVVVTYSPGDLKVYLDGRWTRTDGSIQGGFFHWRPAPLVFGADWNGRDPWKGTLEGVAIYSRALTHEEIRESYSRYRSQLENRPPVRAWTIQATLEGCSETPTLEDIDPYREAMVTCLYRLDHQIAGEPLGSRVRVARWSIMDARPVPLERVGSSRELYLTRLEDNPQLASTYLSDTLESTVEGPLFYHQIP